MKFLKNILLCCILLCLICGLVGCETVAQNRRLKYVETHPELAENQKDLLLNGKLWVGMTRDEARAALGKPVFIGRDKLGEKEDWTYIYKNLYTTRRDFRFERALRLEFVEGRLAYWRED